MIKSCENCVYYYRDGLDEPCCNCDSTLSEWRPSEYRDNVEQPAHYTEYPKEVYEIIKFVLGDDGFKAWCIGNELKYRLRAGLKDKDKMYEDLDKAMKVRSWRQ